MTAEETKTPDTAGQTPAEPTRQPRYCRGRLFLVGALLSAFMILYPARFLALKYTGTTKFERSLDESAVSGEMAWEDFIKQRRTLRLELAGYRAVANAAEELKLVKGERQVDDPSKLTNAGQLAMQELVNKLKSNVSVRWDVRSDYVDYISVSFTHEDPEIAEKMPNELVKAYIDQRSQKTLDVLERSKGFLDRKVTAAKTKITALKEEKIRFETEHAGAMYATPREIQDEIAKGRDRLEILRAQEKVIANSVTELEEAVREYQRRRSTLREVKEPNPRRAELQRQVQVLEKVILSVVGKAKGQDATVKALLAEVARLKAQIEKEPIEITVKKGIDREDLPPDRSKELGAAKIKLVTTQTEIRRAEAGQKWLAEALANFTKTHQDYEKITNALKEKEEGLKQWAGKLRETAQNLQAELGQRRIRLATWQAAQRPTRPTSPSLSRILVTALFVGLGVGLVLAGVPLKLARPGRIIATLAVPVLLLVVLSSLVGVSLRVTDPAAYDYWRKDALGVLIQATSSILVGEVSNPLSIDLDQPESPSGASASQSEDGSAAGESEGEIPTAAWIVGAVVLLGLGANLLDRPFSAARPEFGRGGVMDWLWYRHQWMDGASSGFWANVRELRDDPAQQGRWRAEYLRYRQRFSFNLMLALFFLFVLIVPGVAARSGTWRLFLVVNALVWTLACGIYAVKAGRARRVLVAAGEIELVEQLAVELDREPDTQTPPPTEPAPDSETDVPLAEAHATDSQAQQEEPP